MDKPTGTIFVEDRVLVIVIHIGELLKALPSCLIFRK